jgi:hypothetical protein
MSKLRRVEWLFPERFFSFDRVTDVHHQVVIHAHIIDPGRHLGDGIQPAMDHPMLNRVINCDRSGGCVCVELGAVMPEPSLGFRDGMRLFARLFRRQRTCIYSDEPERISFLDCL